MLTSQPSGHPLAYYRRTRKDANGAPKKNAGIGKNEQAQLPLGMVETLPPPKKIGKTLLSANAGAGNGQDSAEGGKGNAGTGGKASNANATVNATATAKPKGMSKRASKALQSKSSARETEDDEREKEKDEREKEKDESPRPVEIELVVASLLAIFSMKSPDSVGALVPDLPGAGHGAGHGTQTQTQAHTKRDLPPFLAPPRRTETILSETTVAFAPRDPEEEESAGAGGVRANQAQALNEAAQRSPAQVLRET